MVKAENEQVFVDTAGHIPADTTIQISDPITQKFAEAVASGFPRPQVPQLDNFWGNFDNALNLVIQKGEDPAEGGHRRVRRDEHGQQDPVADPRPGAGSAGARTAIQPAAARRTMRAEPEALQSADPRS